MSSTGDLKNNLEKLRTQLRSIHYNGVFDVEAIINGKPEVFLPLLNYCILQFSKPLAKYFIQKGYIFHDLSDSKFIETVYRLLLNEFTYTPGLSVIYFLSNGFAERKIIFICDVIQHCKRKHNELVKAKRKSLYDKTKVKKQVPSNEEITAATTSMQCSSQVPDIAREPKHTVLVRKEPNLERQVCKQETQQRIAEDSDCSDISEDTILKIYDAIKEMGARLGESVTKLDDKVDKNLASLRDRVFLIERRVQTLEDKYSKPPVSVDASPNASRAESKVPIFQRVENSKSSTTLNVSRDTDEFINQLAQKHKVNL
ncbi:hypothetical protein FDP41_000427 [Naegleria fowleri]|uniref:Centrosomal protein of 44 kDa n=1 Tax=Naegleria fowleri TaxID=5763 RepID=A0A6A5CGT7_NAEFO|nr:uncharacterized protein FDP41_000427 [Naegleria fowleri]KAF0984528.1 hypothetical protein FDP41_000427 [Naegleria fowleri]CAG4710020.1 unnamed protein product [Naegleria fowleri]